MKILITEFSQASHYFALPWTSLARKNFEKARELSFSKHTTARVFLLIFKQTFRADVAAEKN
jgi:hypothetical protein